MKKMKLSVAALFVLIFVLFIGTGCTPNIIPEMSDASEAIQTTPILNTVHDDNTTTTSIMSDASETIQTTLTLVTVHDDNTTTASTMSDASETIQTTPTLVTVHDDNTTTVPTEDVWKTKAQQLYKIAWNTYFSIVYNGSYFETNGNTSEKLGDSFCEVSDARVSTVADVKSELRKVFSESYASQYDNQIEEIYKEVDGKLYQQERGKGGVLSLEDIDIEFVSADETQAKFHAVIHNPGSSNVRNTTPFTLVYENGDWKVSEFTDPDLT